MISEFFLNLIERYRSIFAKETELCDFEDDELIDNNPIDESK